MLHLSLKVHKQHMQVTSENVSMLVKDKPFPGQDWFFGTEIPVNLLQLSNSENMSKNSQVNEMGRV